MSTEQQESIYDDHRRPLFRALRFGSIALLVITIGSLAVWGGMRDLPGIWGVLVGAAISGGFMLATVVSVLATAKSSPSVVGAVVLGSWLLKLVVVIIVLYYLRGMSFYDSTALFVTMMLTMVAVLASEVYGIITTNVTYVS